MDLAEESVKIRPFKVKTLSFPLVYFSPACKHCANQSAIPMNVTWARLPNEWPTIVRINVTHFQRHRDQQQICLRIIRINGRRNFANTAILGSQKLYIMITYHVKNPVPRKKSKLRTLNTILFSVTDRVTLSSKVFALSVNRSTVSKNLSILCWFSEHLTLF